MLCNILTGIDLSIMLTKYLLSGCQKVEPTQFLTKKLIAAEFWVDELEDKTAASQIKTLFFSKKTGYGAALKDPCH